MEQQKQNYSQEKIDKFAQIMERAATAAVTILSEIDPDFLTKTYNKSDEESTMIKRLTLGISLEIMFFAICHKKNYFSE